MNTEPQQTLKDELTVERILEKVGVSSEPQTEAGALLWEVRGGKPVPHENPAEKIRIRDGMRFVTLPAALDALFG